MVLNITKNPNPFLVIVIVATSAKEVIGVVCTVLITARTPLIKQNARDTGAQSLHPKNKKYRITKEK